jgi:uncharacterized membrane protein YfcA
MLKRHGTWLIAAGAALIVLACALLFYDAEAGRVAYYPKAMTGFIIPTAIGIVLAVFGVLLRAGRRWALWAALVLLLLAGVSFFTRSQKFRRAAATGEPHKSYACIVVGIMAAVCVITLISVARGVAFLPPPGKENAG